jgi:CheY-like chemotaxis protein
MLRTASERHVLSSADMSTKPVLVAEHDPMQRQLLDLLLAVDAMPIHLVASGEEALQYLREHTPAAAVIAIDLPDLPGATLCQKLKAVTRLASVPVVLLAPEPDPGATLSDSLRREARAAGADLVVQRPLGDKNLRERLLRLIAGAREPAAAGASPVFPMLDESASKARANGSSAASELGSLRAEVAQLQEANDKLRLRLERYKRRVADLEEELAEERNRPRGLFGRRS